MGELFNALSQKELGMIREYIRINTETGNMSAPLDHILRFWDQEKAPLYKAFGNQFILTQDILFERGIDNIVADMEDKVCRYGNNIQPEVQSFINSFFAVVYKTAQDQLATLSWNDKHRFERENPGHICADWGIENLFSAHSLAQNSVEKAFEFTHPETGELIKVCKGAKVTKTIGRIAKLFNLDMDGFEQFRLVHSQVLNQKKLSGRLCLSIHPLDYMTMSDNECDWESCMSWRHEGCYRQGTVEMMNSPMVVVAYLTSDKDMHLGWLNDEETLWNNKKWRQLFVVQKDIITNVKAYPYRNDNLTKICNDWLKQIMENAGYTYDGTYYDWEEVSPVIDNEPVYIRPYTDVMYNDFENSNGLFCYLGSHIKPGYLEFNYSGATECMCCGNTFEVYDEDQGRLNCYDCNPGYCCDECGDSLPYEDDRYWLDDCCYCEYCFNRFAVADSITDDYHHRDNMVEVHLGWKQDQRRGVWKLNFPAQIYYDTYKGVFKRYWGEKPYESDRITSVYGEDNFVDVRDLTELGWSLFAEELADQEKEDFAASLLNGKYYGDPIPEDVKKLLKSVIGVDEDE